MLDNEVAGAWLHKAQNGGMARSRLCVMVVGLGARWFAVGLGIGSPMSFCFLFF